MCKFCEKENKEYILNNDTCYLYIMNNLHIPPQIVFGNYYGTNSWNEKITINYCPLCGEKLGK